MEPAGLTRLLERLQRDYGVPLLITENGAAYPDGPAADTGRVGDRRRIDYLDGHLSSSQRAVFEEHFAVCENCVAYLHSYQQTVKLGKVLREAGAETEIPEELVQAILAARKT